MLALDHRICPTILGATLHESPLMPSAVQGSTNSEGTAPLPLEWFGEIQPRLDGLWLVKKILPANGLALIFGHPGSGKTFLALDIAFHVALGWPWNGRAVKRGLVVYVGAEGTNGLRNRIVAFMRHHQIEGEPVPMALIPVAIDLQGADADLPKLIAAIKMAVAKSGLPLALIVIDTLSKTFGAGKENTDDMATYVANCQRISEEFECCVMPVHHRPKDADSKDPRGHSSLKGGLDTVMLVEGGRVKRMTVNKQRDGEADVEIGFNLTPVVLGIDADDDPVTSCVVAISAVAARPVKTRKLSSAQQVALDVLTRLCAASEIWAPADLPDHLSKSGRPFKVVSITMWRDAVLAVSMGAESRRDSATRMFQKHRDKLSDMGAIHISGEYAWPAVE